jgi:hypothetical protein
VFLTFPVKSGTLRESTAHIPFSQRKSVQLAAHRAMFLCDLPPDSTDILHENYLLLAATSRFIAHQAPLLYMKRGKKSSVF